MLHRWSCAAPCWLALPVVATAACGGSSPPGATSPAPARACTLMAYTQGADIDVLGAGPDPIPWHVEVSASGETLTVEARAADGAGATCGAGATGHDLGCLTRGAQLEVAVTPPLGGMPARIRVASADGLGGPEELTVHVSHGAQSASRTWQPQYSTDEPNGPGCGVRTSATDTLELAR